MQSSLFKNVIRQGSEGGQQRQSEQCSGKSGGAGRCIARGTVGWGWVKAEVRSHGILFRAEPPMQTQGAGSLDIAIYPPHAGTDDTASRASPALFSPPVEETFLLSCVLFTMMRSLSPSRRPTAAILHPPPAGRGGLARRFRRLLVKPHNRGALRQGQDEVRSHRAAAEAQGDLQVLPRPQGAIQTQPQAGPVVAATFRRPRP